jgi:hypothetical protein
MQPDAQVKFWPSPIEFEMAYQVRVAIDRIRFVIKATNQFAHHPRQLQEAGLQHLDALDRLESAERGFQRRFRPKSSERQRRKYIARPEPFENRDQPWSAAVTSGTVNSQVFSIQNGRVKKSEGLNARGTR